MALPTVLLDPPWRRAVTAPPDPRVLAYPLPPPRLEWREGERERFAGPDGKLRGDADERALERLLDRLDDGKPLPLPEVARLSDERLAELADEAPESALELGVVRRMLARLGPSFLPRAIAIVRVRPLARGLFDAVAPVACATLAPKAAAALLAREVSPEELAQPFVRSDAEAWLERFPREASLGCLLTPDAPASRAALSWLAVRGLAAEVEAVVAALSAELDGGDEALFDASIHAQRVAALAPLAGTKELAWVGYFAARGDVPSALASLASARGDEGIQVDEARALAPWLAAALRTSGRARALSWLEAHRAIVAPVLEDQATDPGPAGEDAKIALAVLEGDATRGDPALDDLPRELPPLPPFFDPSALPAPRLSSGEPLTPEAVQVLGELLRYSRLSRPHAGLVQVQQACDAESLDAFGAALLAAWEAADRPDREQWVLEAAGKIGGVVCAGEVARLVRSWGRDARPPERDWDSRSRELVVVVAGNRDWAHARLGCQVLGVLASPGRAEQLALGSLDDLAHHASAAWLRREAKATLDALRDGGVAHRTVEDPPAPDLGLDVDGSMWLDFGPRRFRVAFDELLVPFVRDEEGAALAAFPRTRKSDDAAAAADAKRRFSALKRDAKVVARQQLGSLERAMCARRTFERDQARERFMDHPLLRHVARRLLWGIAAEDHVIAVRVAEDGSLADADDRYVEAPKHARLLVVHPLDLLDDGGGTSALDAWRELFASYEILQPFPQLGREVFTLRGEDRDATHLERLAGATTSRGRLFGLGRRGWEARSEGGALVRWTRELPRGVTASVRVSPGLFLDDPGVDEAQTIDEAKCSRPLGDLEPLVYSELVRDLEGLRR